MVYKTSFLAAILLTIACRHTPLRQLTVENGDGSGRFEPGDEAPVSAHTPTGYRLVAWEGDTGYIQEPTSAQTFVLMPNKDVVISAYTLPQGQISFKYQVFPIIQAQCNFDGCHTNSTKQTNFIGYSEVASASDKIEQYLAIGFMPLNRVMPDSQKQMILDWIAQGRKNN